MKRPFLGFPLPLRERDRVRGKAVATNLLIQTKSAVKVVRIRQIRNAKPWVLPPITPPQVGTNALWGCAHFGIVTVVQDHQLDITEEHFHWIIMWWSAAEWSRGGS